MTQITVQGHVVNPHTQSNTPITGIIDIASIINTTNTTIQSQKSQQSQQLKEPLILQPDMVRTPDYRRETRYLESEAGCCDTCCEDVCSDETCCMCIFCCCLCD
jgi:hypothetical protein